MKKILIFLLLFAFLFSCSSSDPALSKSAESASKEKFNEDLQSVLKIESAWIRHLPEVSKNTAGYMEIRNKSDENISLVSASSEVADRVELHTVVDNNGVKRMVKIDSLDIPPQSSAELKPGANHLMFMGLKQPLKIGDKVLVVIKDDKNRSMKLTIEVKNNGN